MKAACLSLTSPVMLGHCRRSQVGVERYVPYVLQFDSFGKSELYLCFLFTCLFKDYLNIHVERSKKNY